MQIMFYKCFDKYSNRALNTSHLFSNLSFRVACWVGYVRGQHLQNYVNIRLILFEFAHFRVLEYALKR